MPASRPSSAGKRLRATLDAADRAAEEILAEARLEAHEVVRSAERRAIERTEELNRQSDVLMARARQLTRDAEELGNATRELTAQARKAFSVEADAVIEVEILEEGVVGGAALAESTLSSAPALDEEPAATQSGSATDEPADEPGANGAGPSEAEPPADAEARDSLTAEPPRPEPDAGEAGEGGPSAASEPSPDPASAAAVSDPDPPRRKRRFGLFRRRRREKEPESPLPQPSQAELDEVTDEQMTVARSMFAAGLGEVEVEAQLAEILDLARARAIIARLRPARDKGQADRRES